MKQPFQIATKTYARLFLIPSVCIALIAIASSFMDRFVSNPETLEALGFAIGFACYALALVATWALLPLFLKLFFLLISQWTRTTSWQEKIGNVIVWVYWALWLAALLISTYNILNFLRPPA